MICCQHEGNLYIPFLKNVSSFDEMRKIEPVLVRHLLHFWIFCPSKNFIRIKTSDNQRMLCPGNMVGATEFSSLLLQFFDKSLKQRVVWRYRGAVWCPFYWTLPASSFGPLSLNYPVADNTSPNRAFRSVLKARNVLVLEYPTIYATFSYSESNLV